MLGSEEFDVVLNFIGFTPAEVEADIGLFGGRVGQYLFISSATVYAKPPRVLPLTEEAPLGNPIWDYAQMKLDCERRLQRAHAGQGFPATIIRPSHTFGRRWIPNPVSSGNFAFPARIEQGKPVFIPDDGSTLWTLTAASDFAAAVAGLVGLDRAVGEAFHITSDEALPWSRIYEEIAGALGVELPPVVQVPSEFICEVAPSLTGTLLGDKAHPAVFDNAKIKRFVPGWECRKSVREALEESVSWLRRHPAERAVDPELGELIERVIERWRECGGMRGRCR
ncbi:NAD-dependent epimerase/dehydratase family protein [Haloferula sp. A504]|uniref:NAD-dependent epimerase/dehydratase family protein n=1 Tax=Haloferula sp. A504 TaxID=3373601 RepID=UPI0031CC2DAC|nr:NAD-dependent epimerase/dehydratase family protein [Verrucomicrobiaceae bacterium E54]